jgi:hypothetical protein
MPALTQLPDIEITGDLKKSKAFSGAAVVGEYLLVVSDEVKDPTVVQVLRRTGTGFTLDEKIKAIKLPAGSDEVDLEAVAADGDMVYVTGSHAWTRKFEGADLGAPKRKESREQFFRFQLNPDGTGGKVEGPKTLAPAILEHPVLSGFLGVANKENGIDIEGLAVSDGRLFFGFRSPVLRYGYTPVLSCTWQDPVKTPRVAYVRLDGRGIRDLRAVEGGFLILAGPSGDGDWPWRLYFWDGEDSLPRGEDGKKPTFLGEFPELREGKPEALVVLKTSGQTYDLLLLCDGLPNGGPTVWRVTRP